MGESKRRKLDPSGGYGRFTEAKALEQYDRLHRGLDQRIDPRHPDVGTYRDKARMRYRLVEDLMDPAWTPSAILALASAAYVHFGSTSSSAEAKNAALLSAGEITRKRLRLLDLDRNIAPSRGDLPWADAFAAFDFGTAVVPQGMLADFMEQQRNLSKSFGLSWSVGTISTIEAVEIVTAIADREAAAKMFATIASYEDSEARSDPATVVRRDGHHLRTVSLDGGRNFLGELVIETADAGFAAGRLDDQALIEIEALACAVHHDDVEALPLGFNPPTDPRFSKFLSGFKTPLPHDARIILRFMGDEYDVTGLAELPKLGSVDEMRQHLARLHGLYGPGIVVAAHYLAARHVGGERDVAKAAAAANIAWVPVC